tara:strand:+ start:12757 stop:13536 length:780 start_codon:yes stop_codon:yes gene_type:complete
MTSKIHFCSVSINNKSRKNNYLDAGLKWANSILNHSDFNASIITNEPDHFKDCDSSRLEVISCSDHGIKINTGGRRKYFNMNSKLYAMKFASKHQPEYVFYMDGDSYLNENWNTETTLSLLDASQSCNNFDALQHIIYRINGPMARHYAKHNTEHPWESVIKSVGYKSIPNYQAPQETLMIYKNNDKFKNFLSLWGKIDQACPEGMNTSFIGIPVGFCQGKSDMKIITYGRRRHWCGMLNGMGLYNQGKHVQIVSRVCW